MPAKPAALDASPPAAGSPIRAPGALLAAVWLLAATGLIFELTLTRIFSATIWYHYTFVAISVALFGWGLGGFVMFILGAGRRTKLVGPLLVALSLALAIALPLFPWGILQFPFTPERLSFYFSLSLLPFLLGGAALSLAFDAWGSDSNRLYFADLTGAAAGVLLVPLLLGTLGAETAVLATAVLPALAALLISLTLRGRARAIGAGASAVLLLGAGGLTAWNHTTGWLMIRDAPSKGQYQLLRAHPQARVTSDRWNAYSRISSVAGFDDSHLERLYIDSDAWTNVMRWDGTPDSPAGARDWFRAFPFRLADQPRVLVIGPGGGTDVVLAICAGSPLVTAVEMNPLIVDCVRRLGAAAGNLYDHAKVRLVPQEGRNFIERTDEKFDLIVLGFVDSWAAVASGGLSLTENYLYTREAIEAYYDRLTERGALVIIRWPVDVRRLTANAFDLLHRRGMSPTEIGRHILAVCERTPNGDEPLETVFMLCKSPLAPERIPELLRGHTAAHVLSAPRGSDAGSMGLRPVPGASSAPGGPGLRPVAGDDARDFAFTGDREYVELFNATTSLADFGQRFETLATPVTDERPFYFATDKPLGIPDFVVRLFGEPAKWILGFIVLLVGAGWLLGFRAPGPQTWAYFGALGVGFIICEIALLQRLILLLGHPIYTLVVLLFTVLAAGGLGSLAARRIAPQDIGAALAKIIVAVIALMLFAALGLHYVVTWALPLDLSVRVAIAVLLVAPFGFLMGMPFPLGMRRYALTPGAAPPSALWGINGVASVVGSMSGVMLAVAAGFTTVLLTGAACYLLALIVRPR